LHEWLAAVVKDDGSLAHVRELLGVKPEEGN
jgi:type VI secretion system protein ImpA